MVTASTFQVEANWDGDLTGVFLLDVSLLDSTTDLLGGTFGGNAFDDMTADVKSIHIERGRSSDLSSVEMGKCTLVLKDETGKYNPKNPDSDLAGFLVPMRPVRVRATNANVNSGNPVGLFYGFTRRITHNPQKNVKETRIECVDFFTWLSRVKPVIASTGSITAGDAIGLILDAAEWDDPTLRALDDGGTLPDFSADGTKTGLVLIQEIAAIDLGFPFVDGDGVVTYYDRDRRWKSQAAVDTFTQDHMANAEPSTDGERIVNRQSVTREGSTAQTATDDTSRRAYGYSDGTPITSDLLETDLHAEHLAEMLVAIQKDPANPAHTLTLWNNDDTSIDKQLTRELGDYVDVAETVAGTSFSGTIDHLTVDIYSGGKMHAVDYMVTERNITGFTLDTSTLDGTDVLIY